MTPQRLQSIFLFFILLLFVSLCAHAQSTQTASVTPTPSPSPKPAPAPAPIKLGKVTLSGSLRLRFESWDWFESSAAENNYNFGAAVLRVALSQQLEKFEWQVEAAAPLLIGLPDNAVAPAPQGQLGLGANYFAANGRRDGSIFIKQAFIRFKGLGGDKASSLKLGRFEFGDGTEITPADAQLATVKRDQVAQRLIGTFGFTHVGRSFDGLHFSRTSKLGNFTFVGARATEGVFQLRGWNELDVDFYYGSFNKALKTKTSESDLRLFALHYHDGRRALKTDNRPQALRAADTENIRVNTIGGHYAAVVKAGSGKADVVFWGAGQFGDWGKLNHRAGAVTAEAGYQFTGKSVDKLKPWLRAGYFRSTGDGDPADNTHGTFFQVLPTPRPYARFPFYDLVNNEDTFAQLRLKPHAKVSLRTDVHHLRLSNAKDQWYLGGGAFQKNTFGYTGRPSNGQKTLGTLVDFSLDYAVTPTTALTFYIAGVRGGGVTERIYPDGKNSRFAYLELTKRF
ncbi:MAG TPA: alginate export family protein [Blastocatellia bacterium]|nr:alginate export family protein [Blastocatellia bacterium]HMX26627.1 alginate export family protein [Blastocatellia bacterium]HMY73042.1 alginate export family protein [Blastocatellia bacterium]HNG29877.1 alginate export family protein [Blastocatellia bacterium]